MGLTESVEKYFNAMHRQIYHCNSQARGRTCEADHSLMDFANGSRFTMHLPEKVYFGCNCPTNIEGALIYKIKNI